VKGFHPASPFADSWVAEQQSIPLPAARRAMDMHFHSGHVNMRKQAKNEKIMKRPFSLKSMCVRALWQPPFSRTPNAQRVHTDLGGDAHRFGMRPFVHAKGNVNAWLGRRNMVLVREFTLNG